MTAIINRSWLVNMGGNPPPELAYIISDHRGRQVVTWADVLEKRRVAQRERLQRKRAGSREMRAYKVWVGYFDQDLMGGWHAFIESYSPSWWGCRAWIDRDQQWLRPRLLEAFPLLLPLWSERELWERWKIEFARRYARRRQCGQPLGVAYVWWDGHGSPRPAGTP